MGTRPGQGGSRVPPWIAQANTVKDSLLRGLADSNTPRSKWPLPGGEKMIVPSLLRVQLWTSVP